MAESLGNRKLEAASVVGFFVFKALLRRGKGLTSLNLLQFDYPFLILHTMIMAPDKGIGNRKPLDAMKNKKYASRGPTKLGVKIRKLLV